MKNHDRKKASKLVTTYDSVFFWKRVLTSWENRGTPDDSQINVSHHGKRSVMVGNSFPWVLLAHASGCNQELGIIQELYRNSYIFPQISQYIPFSQIRNHIMVPYPLPFFLIHHRYDIFWAIYFKQNLSPQHWPKCNLILQMTAPF